MSLSSRLNCVGGSGGRPGKVDCGTSTSEDNMMYGGGQTTQAPAPPMEVATSGSEGEPATTPLSPLSYSQRQQLEDLNEQMSDISQHIDLTSSQIERLRSKFARYESPPSFYYEQQEEYTNKLQDFNVRKQMLQEQIHQIYNQLTDSAGSSDNMMSSVEGNIDSGHGNSSSTSLNATAAINSSSRPTVITNEFFPTSSSNCGGSPAPTAPQDDNRAFVFEKPALPLHPPPLPASAPLALLAEPENLSSDGDVSATDTEAAQQPPPKSPAKTIIRAYMGDLGHTFVSSKPGVTVSEALKKAMKNRQLLPEACIVYRCSDPHKTPIPWDSDISQIGSESIKVELQDSFPVMSSISHDFERKNFTLAFCEKCRRLLFSGFICRTCGYKFHQRCANGVPTLCQQSIWHHLDSLKQIKNEKQRNNELDRLYKLLAQTQPDRFQPDWNHLDWNDPDDTDTDDPKDDPGGPGSKPRSLSTPNIPVHILSAPIDCPKITSSQTLPMGTVPLSELFQLDVGNVNSPSKGAGVGGQAGSSVAAAAGAGGTNRSESSSPTSTLKKEQHRARASVSGIEEAESLAINTSATLGSQLVGGNPSAPQGSSNAGSSKERKSSQPEARTGSDENWQINHKEILVWKKCIGKGSFGTVYKGYYHGSVAVKTLNVVKPSPEQIQAFRNEVGLLKRTRHVNVLLFVGFVSVRKSFLAIITQWCEGSSLHRHIHVAESISSNESILNIVEIARQASQGMDYLHAKHIIHRDLKSNNIFLHDDNFTVKIGDFGLATVKARWKDSQPVRQPTGSILWMAPEIIKIKTEDAFSYQSDVYAFGIVLYELLSGILPYSDGGTRKNGSRSRRGLTVDQILWLVGTGQVTPNMEAIRADTPSQLRKLVMDCIQYERDKRPLFQYVLGVVEEMMRTLPKIHRSMSEPILNRPGVTSELLGGTSGAEGGVTVTSVGVGPAGVNSYAKNAYVA